MEGRATLKILFLSYWFPFPADNGSRLRVSWLVKGLAQEHRLHLITLDNREPGQAGLRVLEDLGVTHLWLPRAPYRPNSIRAVAGFLSSKPRSIAATDRKDVALRIEEEVREGDYDLAVVSELGSATYFEGLNGIPAILDELECGVFANRSEGASSSVTRLRSEMTNFKLKRYLRRLLKSFRACTVVSEQERRLVQEWVPDCPEPRVIPNCLSLENYQVSAAGPREPSAIFPGALSFALNRQAVEWFQRDILPLVTAKVSDFRVYVTGEASTREVAEDPRFILTGYLDRPRFHALFGRVKACIVPLLEGGGTRLKILEAMALGVPVVSTPLGAQGLDVQDGVHLCLARSPEDFGNAVIRVLSDPALRRRLATAGLDYVKTHHDGRAVMQVFLNLVKQVGAAS